MTPDKLTFGTDGWRDIIGDIYTFKNVSRVAQAYAQHLLEKGTPSVRHRLRHALQRRTLR